MKNLFFILLLFVLVFQSCLVSKNKEVDLIKSNIERYYNDNNSIDGYEEREQKFFTQKYIEFSGDVKSLEYEEGLSDEQFLKKWENIYSIKNISSIQKDIFLVPQQAWGKIVVSEVKLIQQNPSGYWYSLRIEDLTYEKIYHRKIYLIRTEKDYKIDAVEAIP